MLLLFHDLRLVQFEGFLDFQGLIRVLLHQFSLAALDCKDVIVVDTIVLLSCLFLELFFDDLDWALVLMLVVIVGAMVVSRVSTGSRVMMMLILKVQINFMGLNWCFGSPKEFPKDKSSLIKLR